MNESVERVRDVLAGLIKAALVSDDRKSLDFRSAADAARHALAADPPDPGSVRIDGAWTLAIREAETPELLPDEGQVSLTFPVRCPFTLDELLASAFDVDEAVERLRKAAATG